jgi:glycosyltransferase involved in cell wall biosynthesis
MKVLVSAYACEPHKGSEQGVGWQWVRQISRYHETWVITRANNRPIIEEELHRHPNSALHFEYIDLPRWISFWKKGERGLYLYYYLWQLCAYLLARRLHAVHHFSAVHHITFGAVWLPTFMQFLGVPFIWGPLGGAEAVPDTLRPHMKFRWRIYEKIRDIIIKWTFTLDPIARSAAKRASLIIARTKITRDAFPSGIRSKTILMIETGVSKEFIQSLQAHKGVGNLPVILMAGRMLHWKGFDLGIEAFSRLLARFPQARLVVVGLGPEEKPLKSLAERLNISGRVHFTGQLPREDVLRLMAQAHVFLMPSMKDAGAWVLYEAMAAGLPVVCLDYAGPAEIVDESCAFKVPVGDKEEVVENLRRALEMLLSSPTKAVRMGHASIKRLEDAFLWDHKGAVMKQIYQSVVGGEDFLAGTK